MTEKNSQPTQSTSIDRRQFNAACRPDGPAWAKQHEVTFLMTHQGPDWLNESSEHDVYPDINPSGRFAVHFFGHMHEEFIKSESLRGGPQKRLWLGNSLFSEEPLEGGKTERRHGYSAGSLIFENGNAYLRHCPKTTVIDSNGIRFIRDEKGCVLETDGGTKREFIELNTIDPSNPPVDSIVQETDQIIAHYQRKVRAEWESRWELSETEHDTTDSEENQ